MAKTEPRLYFKDEQDHYWVQSAGMKEPAQVPDDKKSEVDEVIGDADDAVGFTLGTFALSSPRLSSGAQLRAIGACPGTCGRSFGVQYLAR